MRVVLYAYDLEPITIFEISQGIYNTLMKQRCVKLLVESKPQVTPSCEPPSRRCLDIVEIHSQIINVNGHQSLLLFTHNEETALKLKAVFLPGQYNAVQAMQKNAYAYGFMTALRKLGES